MAKADRTVSIIITNYNYAEFLGAAIRSALEQSYPLKEVIVVDDGSTDRSRQVIESFGDRIRPLYKENGGQRSACNLGFAASTGDVVLFLDGDDAWRIDAVERTVAAMMPTVAAVQFCVAILDPHGNSLGGIYPPLPETWTPSRIRDCVHKSGFYPCPPTSGNAYARWFLDRIMPVAADDIRDAIDGPLNTVAPLHGDVVVLKEPLGYYRIHGSNVGALSNMTAERFSYFVNLDRDRGRFLIEQARALGVTLDERVLDRAFFHLQYRLASLKLRPDLHPLKDDSLLKLPWMLARAALRAPDRPMLRIFVVLWGAAVAVAPRRLAEHLVAMRFISSVRPALLDVALSRLKLVRRLKGQGPVVPPYEFPPRGASSRQPKGRMSVVEAAVMQAADDPGASHVKPLHQTGETGIGRDRAVDVPPVGKVRPAWRKAV
jgi:glycosyltransferase involved in cell wall biosynthesis